MPEKLPKRIFVFGDSIVRGSSDLDANGGGSRMIKDNIEKIKKNLPDGIELVVVTKYRSDEEVQAVYDAGVRKLAENRALDLAKLAEKMPADIKWQMIGHLQRNKVKYIAAFVDCIHSLDSLRLLQEIDKQAKKHDRVIDCLLQIKIAEEESKFGLSLEEAKTLLESREYKQVQNVRVKGVMGMASFSSNTEQVRGEFQKLKNIFEELRKIFWIPSDFEDGMTREGNEFSVISAGMSSDYEIAIQEGSTMVRVGSGVFN